MDETPSPAPAVPPAAPAPRRRGLLGRLLASFSWYLAGVAAVLGLLAGGLGWLLYSTAGAAWLLARVPGLQVSEPAGSLLGGFSARQVDLKIDDDGTLLRLQQLQWTAMHLRPGDARLWLRIAVDELRAERVDLWVSDTPATDTPVPESLELPLGLDITRVRVDALHIDGIDTPLRDLQAAVSLAANGGRLHTLKDLQAQWDQLRATGRAQVGTEGPLALDAQVQLTPEPGAARDWAADLTLQGPLATPTLRATLRAPAAAGADAQTLDAQATLRPFAAWPLGELQAQARGLDLSALHAGAPRTALDLQASARTQASDQPAQVQLTLDNRGAGRWNDGRVPVRSLRLELQARPDDPRQWQVQTFDAELGGRDGSAGRLSGSGQWNPADWRFDTRLAALRPVLLDARAPDMRLDGRLQLHGSGFDAPEPGRAQVDLRGNLEGRLLAHGPAQPVQMRLDARLNLLRIELLELLAESGSAQARLSGRLTRPSVRAGWTARAQGSLRDFDPLPWWPGPADSPWRRGPHKLNAAADIDLALPTQGGGTLGQQLARLRGRADLTLQPSRLAGVPLEGRLGLQTGADGHARGQLQLLADGNRVQAEAQLDRPADGAGDHWTLKADLPALKRLQPLWALWLGTGADARLEGKLQTQARIDGRWPALASSGQLQADALRVGELQIERSDARWKLGTRKDAPLDALVELKHLRHGAPSAERVVLSLKGTAAAHTLALEGETKALPPAWVETMQDGPPGAKAKRTLLRMQWHGAALPDRDGSWLGWRGALQGMELRGDVAATQAWLKVEPFDLDLRWAGGPLRLKADAGRARLLGATFSWTQVAWSAADGAVPARLDADAKLEPLDVAPLLARAQPGFGWGGDLRLAGRFVVQSSPTFSADVGLERSSGDLTVTDDAGTRSLGLSDLRIGLNARDGLWNIGAGLAGRTLGSAAAAVAVRSTPKALWPARDAPMDGVLELRIADLGVWGPWLPAGWRLGGGLNASATLGGLFGAPEFTGELNGQNIGVRNVLQGVDVRDGELKIVMLGETARIEKFAASAGQGKLALRGDANLGAAPRAELNLTLEQFQLLGRVDRRIVASGEATLKLARDSLALTGQFGVDEGLIDFSRSEAPRLSDDVHVLRGAAEAPALTPVAVVESEVAQARRRNSVLDLRVQLGDKLRIRGNGLDAGLRGDLRLSAPQGRLRVDGSVRTVDGTYRAYRQRLNIDRGVLTFNGPIENPQLDIEATRPNLDVRVGVAVTGTVLVPRVRLFSDPEMSDADKLSWLLRGRASEGPGTGDTALLQAAAMAMLSGDEPNALDNLFNVIGLDDLSVRQSDSAGGGAIVSVGKQLSRNWYVGYERGLNATTGNWQLIYRVAQRFTVRAQSGEQNSIELIWSWRWN